MNSDFTPPTEAANADAVREQLKRLLEHHVFKGSRRCARLLEYLVEYRLRGETAAPKERTLGIEVFERESDYDTADDPVVRGAANETCKRIAQYYLEPGHENELRFGLHAGSYMLEFRMPVEEVKPQIVQNLPPARRGFSLYYLILSAAALALCVLGIIWYPRPGALDRFWSPVLDSSNGTLICVLRTASERADSSTDAIAGAPRPPIESSLGIPFVGYPDTMALVNIIRFLDAKKTKLEVQYQTLNGNLPLDSIKPGLDDLRKGPAVFVGGSDWTYKIMPSLRFHTNQDTATGITWIEDGQNPAHKKWSIKNERPFADYTEDYAIISRVFDTMTGQILVLVTGIGLHGTAAAGEFVTSSSLMNQIAPGNSPEWRKKNVQIVIHTKIAGDAWGTPQLLAKHFW
jgi:hypothetical protein